MRSARGARCAAATSAPGLESSPPDLHWDWTRPMSHLHRDLAHPCRCHMCTGTWLALCRTGTGLTPCHIRTGTGLTLCHICTGTGLTPAGMRPAGAALEDLKRKKLQARKQQPEHANKQPNDRASRECSLPTAGANLPEYSGYPRHGLFFRPPAPTMCRELRLAGARDPQDDREVRAQRCCAARLGRARPSYSPFCA